MAKFYTVEREINGVNYKAQFSGISAALNAVDNSYIEGSNNTSVASKSKTEAKKREYSKKELDSLFDNIFEVEI